MSSNFAVMTVTAAVWIMAEPTSAQKEILLSESISEASQECDLILFNVKTRDHVAMLNENQDMRAKLVVTQGILKVV